MLVGRSLHPLQFPGRVGTSRLESANSLILRRGLLVSLLLCIVHFFQRTDFLVQILRFIHCRVDIIIRVLGRDGLPAGIALGLVDTEQVVFENGDDSLERAGRNLREQTTGEGVHVGDHLSRSWWNINRASEAGVSWDISWMEVDKEAGMSVSGGES